MPTIPDTNAMGRLLTESRLRAAAEKVLSRDPHGWDELEHQIIEDLFDELGCSPLVPAIESGDTPSNEMTKPDIRGKPIDRSESTEPRRG